jgi:hypothetical protein
VAAVWSLHSVLLSSGKLLRRTLAYAADRSSASTNGSAAKRAGKGKHATVTTGATAASAQHTAAATATAATAVATAGADSAEAVADARHSCTALQETATATAAAASVGRALLLAWLLYTAVWHCVLSNLSLSAPMPRAVHSRFWMQPNLLLCILAGGGGGVVLGALLPRGSMRGYRGVCELAIAAVLGLLLAARRWPEMDRLVLHNMIAA